MLEGADVAAENLGVERMAEIFEVDHWLLPWVCRSYVNVPTGEGVR